MAQPPFAVSMGPVNRLLHDPVYRDFCNADWTGRHPVLTSQGYGTDLSSAVDTHFGDLNKLKAAAAFRGVNKEKRMDHLIARTLCLLGGVLFYTTLPITHPVLAG